MTDTQHFEDCPGCTCELRAENERLRSVLERYREMLEGRWTTAVCPRVQCQEAYALQARRIGALEFELRDHEAAMERAINPDKTDK